MNLLNPLHDQPVKGPQGCEIFHVIDPPHHEGSARIRRKFTPSTTCAFGTPVAVQSDDAEDVMFDLYTGNVRHMPHRTAMPILVSSGVQGTALAALALMSFLIATRELPAVPDVLAFVAELPAAAPPPPPPPPRVAQAVPQAPPANPAAAPLEAPTEIAPEPVAAPVNDVAGVEGGVVGGVVGGIPALAEAPPPPPPPPPPVSHEPVRIGGQVSAPALVKRVEPVYPAIAQLAAIDGVVILDAIVDEHGRIQSVKVLRGHPLLAKAASEAVQQWEYEPLKLNGSPTPFELTVSLWFHFDEKAKKRS